MRLRRALGAAAATVLVAAAGVGWQSDIAGAAATGATSNVPVAAVPWDSVLHIPRFDPQQGRLTAAHLELVVTNVATFDIENLDPVGHTGGGVDAADWAVAVSGSVDFADGAVPEALAANGFPSAVTVDAEPGAFSLAPFDEAIDHAGPSGLHRVVTATEMKTIDIVDELDLAALVGGEDLVLPASGAQEVFFDGTGAVDRRLSASVGVEVSVRYEYLPGAIDVTVTPADQLVASGGPATFTVVVRNAGLLALSAITVGDTAGSSCNSLLLADLAPSEQTTLQCTVAAVAPVSGDQVSVTVNASGQSDGGRIVDDSATATITVARPQVGVQHQALHTEVVAGGTASFATTITNTGNVALTGGTIEDPAVPDCARPLPALPVGASFAYTCSLVEVTADVVSELTVRPLAAVGVAEPVTVTVPITVTAVVPTAPAIDVENAINGQDADEVGPTVTVGQSAALTAVVTNVGSERLSAITVTDSVAGALTCPSAVLELGSSMTCTAAPTTAAQAGSVTHRTTATGAGTATPPVVATDEDLAVYTVQPADGGGGGGDGDGGEDDVPCEASEDLLVGLTFSVGGGPAVGSLAELDARPGDSIRVHWDAFAPGAEHCRISLAQYATPNAAFDPDAEQTLVQAVTCVAGACPAAIAPARAADTSGGTGTASGGFELVLTVQHSTDGPFNQFDLVTGEALERLGPGGRFYSLWLNGVLHRLLSAGTSPRD